MKISEKIEKLMHVGIKRTTIAKKIGVHASTVTYWLDGSHRPSKNYLKIFNEFYESIINADRPES